jgi:heme/copper-type cytochrome/quinol oxidase subunit 2
MEVNTTTTTDPVNYYNKFNNFILNPMVFIIVILIIVAYFVFSSSLGNSDNQGFRSITGDDSGGQVMSVIIVVVLIILIIVNGLQYFFSISVTAYLSDLFTNKPTVGIVVDQTTYQGASSNPSNSFSTPPVPEIRFKKEVFNIPGNYYDYTNAKALCQA